MSKSSLVGVFLVIMFFMSGCAITSELVVEDEKPQVAVIKKEETSPLSSMKKIPPLPKPKEPKKMTVLQKEMGMSLADAVYLIDEFIKLKSKGYMSGIPKFSGISENNLITLEIFGRRSNISQAAIILSYPKNIKRIDSDLNRSIMTRFLKNCVPDYGDWLNKGQEILNKFNGTKAGKKIKENLHIGKRSIKIIYDKEIGSITIIITS